MLCCEVGQCVPETSSSERGRLRELVEQVDELADRDLPGQAKVDGPCQLVGSPLFETALDRHRELDHAERVEARLFQRPGLGPVQAESAQDLFHTLVGMPFLSGGPVDLEDGRVTLSDRSREPLVVETLSLSPWDGALVSRVKRDLVPQGLPARWTHAAQAELLGAVEADTRGWLVRVAGRSVLLPAALASSTEPSELSATPKGVASAVAGVGLAGSMS